MNIPRPQSAAIVSLSYVAVVLGGILIHYSLLAKRRSPATAV